MKFWVLWVIGIAIVIGTRYAIYKLIGYYDSYYVEATSKYTQLIMNLIANICINLVGGIAYGNLLNRFADEERIRYFLVAIILAFFVYAACHDLIGLNHFSNHISHIIFFVVFIISIIGWTRLISDYNRNIETITETTVFSKEKRELLYFCNIPVQEISGQISGSSALGSGSISGSISTSDELPYWYANENNEGIYDSAKASRSKIIFISNQKKPYLEIIHYCRYTKRINHNNGKEDIKNENHWEEYNFYLPEEVKQYSLD